MAVGTVANYTNGVKLGNQRAKEVLEYEKILKVHTDVVANVHPQLSLPSQPVKQSSNYHQQGLAPAAYSPRLQNGIQKQAKATTATSTQPKIPNPALSLQTPPSHKAPATKTAPASSGFDPLFLTKSDILVKAELHQKRQQIERALKEQLNQSRVILRQKTSEQETLPNFNIMNVLKEAQQIVKPITLIENNGTNRNVSSSDSFDEKTFYSSQMNDSTTEEERSSGRPKKTCRFFFDQGNCRKGNDCSFSHDSAHKEVLEADGPKAMDIDSVTADEQAIIRPTQIVQPNEPPSHPSPPEDPGELAKLKHAKQIEQLEEQLRNLKSSVLPNASRPLKDSRSTHDEAVYSPLSVAAPLVDRQSRLEEIREPERDRRKDSIGNRAPPRPESRSREYIRQNQNPHSPVVSDVRVVRNHITSPVAPQPSRVSPLAVSRVPTVHQGQRVIGDEHRQPRRSAEDVPSARHSPRPGFQDLNPRKRRRADSNGRGRFVIARRESPGRRQSPVVRRESPEMHIKEEPISPPPFATATPDAWQPRGRQYVPRPVYVETGSPRYRDLQPVVYQPRTVNQLSQHYIADERRPQSPMVRRVISRNAQHVSAHEEQSLRRVVSARQLRITRSPPGQYVPPQPSSARAAPQVYIPQASHPISVQPRASVQPHSLSKLERDQSASPRPVARLSPTIQRPTMAPPARRLVVDRYGQTFEAPLAFERQPSVVPVAHPTEFIPRYEQIVPRSPSLREPRLVNVYDDGRYIRRAPSPHYVEYHTAPASRHVLDREVEPFYREDIYLPRHEPLRAIEYTDSRSADLQEEVMRHREIIRTASVRPGEVIRTASVRPTGADLYEEPREPISKMQSVRPEQDGISPSESRRIAYPSSIRTDRAMSRPIAYTGMERPKYRYTTETQERRYVGELPKEVIYETARGRLR